MVILQLAVVLFRILLSTIFLQTAVQSDINSLLSNFTLYSGMPSINGSLSASYISNKSQQQDDILLLSKSGNILKYNIPTKTFTGQSTNTSFEINTAYSHSSVQIDDKIYFNSYDGGIGTYNVETNRYKYPFNQNSSLPIKLIESCLATDGRYLFVIGGSDGTSTGVLRHFQIYDTKKSTWLNNNFDLPLLNSPRALSACQVINGYVYIFGGIGPNLGLYDSIESIHIGTDDKVSQNLQTESWEILPSKLRIAKAFLGSVVCSKVDPNLVFIMNGIYETGGAVSDIEIFNVSDNNIYNISLHINQARSSAEIVCDANSSIYIFGGLFLNQTLNTWEISNLLPVITPTPKTPRKNKVHMLYISIGLISGSVLCILCFVIIKLYHAYHKRKQIPKIQMESVYDINDKAPAYKQSNSTMVPRLGHDRNNASSASFNGDPPSTSSSLHQKHQNEYEPVAVQKEVDQDEEIPADDASFNAATRLDDEDGEEDENGEEMVEIFEGAGEQMIDKDDIYIVTPNDNNDDGDKDHVVNEELMPIKNVILEGDNATEGANMIINL